MLLMLVSNKRGSMSERASSDRLTDRPEYGSPQDIINDFERFVTIVEWFASEGWHADTQLKIKKRVMFNNLLLKREFNLEDPEKIEKFIKIAEAAYRELNK